MRLTKEEEEKVLLERKHKAEWERYFQRKEQERQRDSEMLIAMQENLKERT